MNQMSKFELNSMVNESRKSILLKLYISEKRHSHPVTKTLTQRPLDTSRIWKITSNITVSWIFGNTSKINIFPKQLKNVKPWLFLHRIRGLQCKRALTRLTKTMWDHSLGTKTNGKKTGF